MSREINKHPKVVVVLPAYNAAKTLEKTVADIPKDVVDTILLVDDRSTDKTLSIAKELNLTVEEHDKNLGYGGNQKTCYTLALQQGADIIIMLHPDYQYDPKLIRYFVSFIRDGYFDVMLGSRIRSRKEAIAGGMPIYKYYANRILTLIENFAAGYNLSEWHTGMRAYKRDVLERIDFMNYSNDFVFDTQVLFRIIAEGYRVGEIPVPVRYSPEASSINFLRSVRYGMHTLWIAITYWITKKS
ncbi:glycosyltransferase family 2 protein [Candidatus Woesebacteria bacterium]|nr:glycosyltransferase family 2 protein [Candidatus Woesebacteria bacterium]